MDSPKYQKQLKDVLLFLHETQIVIREILSFKDNLIEYLYEYKGLHSLVDYATDQESFIKELQENIAILVNSLDGKEEGSPDKNKIDLETFVQTVKNNCSIFFCLKDFLVILCFFYPVEKRKSFFSAFDSELNDLFDESYTE